MSADRNQEYGKKLAQGYLRRYESVVQIHFENDKFAMNFPEKCRYRGYVCGTDSTKFLAILEGNIPKIEWNSGKLNVDETTIDSLTMFDLLEFATRI